MGSCVSSHKSSGSSMRMGFSVDSKPQDLLIQSPTNEKSMKGENPNAEFDGSQSMKSCLNASYPNIGTKEEAFFDSQAWLESDCEDDFISVNGDYPLSGSSSPNNQRNTLGKTQVGEVSFEKRLPHSKPSSPTAKKMILSELFKKSLQEDLVTSDDQSAGNGSLGVNLTRLEACQKSSEKTPSASRVNSMCSSETTPNIDPNKKKEETLKSTQCCLPSFVHSFSFRERKNLQSSSHKENNSI